MSVVAHTDQMGRKVFCPVIPLRIISLVPSITELLFDLGLSDRIAGRTKFCILPHPDVKSIPVIGGTKQIHFDIIDSIQPDLIIGSKEENTKTDIEKLEKSYPIWMSDVNRWEEMTEMITEIGKITAKEDESRQINAGFEQLYMEWREYFANKRLNVAYMIWRNPYMVVGSDTFIHNFLEFLGIKNAFGHFRRYPEINTGTKLPEKPGHVFLSSEPYPFDEKHFDEIQTLFPGARVIMVDGMFFSWYGSRLLHMKKYLYELNTVI